MALAPVTLDDKYALESGRVFLTGTQALVRLPMMQRRRDEAAGLNTGCFITGYRGSPLGLVDQQLWQAKTFLERHHIRFQPILIYSTIHLTHTMDIDLEFPRIHPNNLCLH